MAGQWWAMKAGLLATRWLMIQPSTSFHKVTLPWDIRQETFSCTLVCKYYLSLEKQQRSHTIGIVSSKRFRSKVGEGKGMLICFQLIYIQCFHFQYN